MRKHTKPGFDRDYSQALIDKYTHALANPKRSRNIKRAGQVIQRLARTVGEQKV